MQRLRKIPLSYLFLGTIIFLIVIISLFDFSNQKTGNSASPANPARNQQKTYRQEKEEGNVDVVVEYLPDKSSQDTLTFEIALDTHSVNLDSFDFQKDIFLKRDGSINFPLTVIPSGGGHHRRAEVTFKKVSAPFSIILNNLSGISKREFKFSNL